MLRGLLLVTLSISLLAGLSGVVARDAHAARRVTPSERRAINRTLDVFVPAAVARRNPGSAYSLATWNLRGGSSRADWAHGDLPAYPYQPRGTRFHSWTFSYREGNLVAIDLMLQPGKKEKAGPLTLGINLKRVHGRWLVDSILPEASFAPAGVKTKVVGPWDTVAPGAGLGPPTAPPRLGSIWLTVPVSLVGLGLAIPFAFLLVKWRRDRRAAQAFERPAGARRTSMV